MNIRKYLREITLPMWASLAMALLVGGYLTYRALRSQDPLLPLLALTAALVGWVVAILATPYSPDEERRFSEFAKILSGIVTGFLLSKIGPLLDALTRVPEGGRAAITQPRVAGEVLITLASFFIALLFVFGGRQYWSPKSKGKGKAPGTSTRTDTAAKAT